MDALQAAREALTWIDGTDTDNFFFARAQAYAAVAQVEAQQQANVIAERQAAALEKIAGSLCMDNDLTVIDVLYALVEAISKHR